MLPWRHLFGVGPDDDPTVPLVCETDLRARGELDAERPAFTVFALQLFQTYVRFPGMAYRPDSRHSLGPRLGLPRHRAAHSRGDLHRPFPECARQIVQHDRPCLG